MKVVVDTNTLISGLLWRGAPSRIIDTALTGQIQLCSSAGLLDEFDDVVHRKKFSSRLALLNITATDLLAGLADFATLVDPAPLERQICRDPDDDLVLATALAAKADYIVTGDRDLLVVGSFRGVRIVTPADFIQLLAGSAGT